MELTTDQIIDLVTTTQKELGKMKWTDIATDLQEFIALPQILQKSKVEFQSGQGIQFNAMAGNSNAAKNVGLYGIDTVNVQDVMVTGSVPWRHQSTNYAFERREMAINTQPYQIVDLIKARRVDALVSLAKLDEANLWGKPVDATDDQTPFGVQYWFTRSATEGFNGGDPAGFPAGRAGLPTGTYPRWANWTGQYAAVTKEDLVTKMRKAVAFCNFISPVPQPQYVQQGPNPYGIYSCYAVVAGFETLAEQQNDNLGNDVASKDGRATFRGNPVIWAPFLESDTAQPVYGINWRTIKPVFLTGEYMREDPPEKAPNQHTVLRVFVDCTHNYVCRDLRRNFVFTL